MAKSINQLMPLLTQTEAHKIINSLGKIKVTLDLGKSISEVNVKEKTVEILYNGQDNELSLKSLEKIKKNRIYYVENNQIHLMAFFSDETNYYYQLIPSNDWPTFHISSTPMHRYRRMSPAQQLNNKMKILKPEGRILDTCCGLGYSAIAAAKKAKKVITFEIDNNSLKMCKYNPFSQDLFKFTNLKIIEQDVFKGIKQFSNNYFDRISHDPPKHQYAPLLYSRDFYKEMFRVLKPEGVMFHYLYPICTPHGKQFFENTKTRLEEVGFIVSDYDEDSSGVICKKV